MERPTVVQIEGFNRAQVKQDLDELLKEYQTLLAEIEKIRKEVDLFGDSGDNGDNLKGTQKRILFTIGPNRSPRLTRSTNWRRREKADGLFERKRRWRNFNCSKSLSTYCPANQRNGKAYRTNHDGQFLCE